jgi:hypothetical protein
LNFHDFLPMRTIQFDTRKLLDRKMDSKRKAWTFFSARYNRQTLTHTIRHFLNKWKPIDDTKNERKAPILLHWWRGCREIFCSFSAWLRLCRWQSYPKNTKYSGCRMYDETWSGFPLRFYTQAYIWISRLVLFNQMCLVLWFLIDSFIT